jgi:ABC-type dipeptide/oligopeptide/nickel transport system permease component
MMAYVGRRILTAIPVMFLAVTAVFFAFRVIPGDPAQLYFGEHATHQQVEQLRKELGENLPLLTQYWNYVSRLMHGNLGTSITTGQPVAEMVGQGFVQTMRLVVIAIAIAVVIGGALGILAAVKYGTVWDHLSGLIALLGMAIPLFWLALLLELAFSVDLHWLPAGGDGSSKSLIMPAVCLAVYSLAFIARMTRASLLETYGQDYIRTARAKGMQERTIIVRHALPNALPPILTIIGLRLGYMIAGAVVIEQIFAWPGIGHLMLTGIEQRDTPVIEGTFIIFVLTFMVINLLVDIAHGLLDPRVREARRTQR